MKHALYFLMMITHVFVLGSNTTNGQANITNHTVRVAPDLELYYIEAGTGSPVIFVPGWAGTSTFFEKQIAFFSKNYRALSYDPRSQGRSSKTVDHNDYIQHGIDLKSFIDTMQLKDVILVGHSAGCLDIYGYIRSFGTRNVKALVFVDEPPKTYSGKAGDWVWYNSFSEMQDTYAGISFDRLNLTRAFLKTLFKNPISEQQLKWFTDETMKTPTYAALATENAGNMLDFSKELQQIDGKLPVLYVIADRTGYTEFAKSWLHQNASHAKVQALGLHMMFWEFPEKFNRIVADFIAQ